MQVVYARCAGLDVHKKTVSACISVCEVNGVKQQQTRAFGTFTQDLLKLADWLKEHGVTHVAMEATGVYWRPVWAMLEGHFEQMLVNPHHIKAVPGRKMDTKDCEWIGDLLQHGLLKGSFVPATLIQDLRDLTRYRAELRQSQNRVANRIQKPLEQANVKLSSVASDTLGVSGRHMLEAIIAGQDDPQQLAQLAHGQLKKKIPQLQQALAGRVWEHHRLLLAEYLDEWDVLEERIRRIESEIDTRVRPFESAVTLWLTVPGVDRVTACSLVAKIGVEMKQFPTAQHLASWAALCPGNHESTGKRKSGKTRDGNKWLRRSLCQAAAMTVNPSQTISSLPGVRCSRCARNSVTCGLANGAGKKPEVEIPPRHPAVADSVFHLKRYCSTGVCPRGANIRQRCGRSLNPLSSMKTMVRTSFWAVF